MKMNMDNDVDLNKIDLRAGKDDEDNPQVMATIKMSFLLDEAKAEECFGERFVRMAFNKDTDGNFLYHSMKPDDTIEASTVTMSGLPSQKTQPSFQRILPVDDGEICVHLKMNLVFEDKKTIVTLIKRLGASIHLVIQPTQMELPLD